MKWFAQCPDNFNRFFKFIFDQFRLLERNLIKDEVYQRGKKTERGNMKFTKKWNSFNVWQESNNLWT